MNYKKTFKICKNRNLSRIFLDKQSLIPFGITFNDRYDYIMSDKVITIRFNPNGLKKISGNLFRPIIDIMNKRITEFFKGFKYYECHFMKSGNSIDKDNSDKIIIRGVN